MNHARIVLAIVGCTAVVVVMLLARRNLRVGQDQKPPLSAARTLTPVDQLRALAEERDDYVIFVGLPLAAPDRWTTVMEYKGDSFLLKDESAVPVSEIGDYVVVYPNGQLVIDNRTSLPLPEGITGLTRSSNPVSDILQPADLRLGETFIRVSFGPSTSRPSDRNHYSTTLTNLSDENVKVVRFAGYSKTQHGWELSTVTGKFFSADEFNAWYGPAGGEWISPGKSATDANNYGSPPVLWAYYCESESGKQFIASGIIR